MFTLEFSVNENAAGVLNVPRTPLPLQLEKLAVPENEWTDVYDYAVGVVDRAIKREEAKKQVKEQQAESKKVGSWGFGGKKNKNQGPPPKDKYDEQIDKLDASTEKGWATLTSKALAMGMSIPGVCAIEPIRVEPMRDVHTKQIYGLEFKCDSTKLKCTKVVLRYDSRRDAFNLLRHDVPKELSDIGVTVSTWTSAWDLTDDTQKRQSNREQRIAREKNIMKHKNISNLGKDMGHLALTGDTRRDTAHIQNYIFQVVNTMDSFTKANIDTEKDWKLLESRLADMFLEYGVIVSSLMDHINDSSLYAGIEFRILPSSAGK